MTTLLDIWLGQKDFFEAKSIEQVISISGDGNLRDGNEASAQLRQLLANIPAKNKNQRGQQGRVIRRYRRHIPIAEFDSYSELIRGKAKGCGLYALYAGTKLVYVGLATKSIRSRIHSHINRARIPFTHFSVFLVTGKTSEAQARRIRDLEALLLKIIGPTPEWNRSITNFVAAKRLEKNSRPKRS